MRNHIFYLFTVFITFPGIIHGQHHNAFTQNKGQWENNILFKTPLPYGALFIEENDLTYTFYNPEDVHSSGAHHSHLHEQEKRAVYVRDKKVNFHCFKIEFLHANKNVSFQTGNPQKGYANYFTGQDKTKWASKINSFQTITYKNLYNGIDLLIEKPGQTVKYTFIVHPFANPNDIRLKYEGHDSLFVNNNELHIITSFNSVLDSEPISYQKDKNKAIQCNFSSSNNVVQFNFPNGYDKSLPLTIDPEVIFATYSGSTADNWGFTATHDSYGNGYSGGIVFNVGYPVTTGAYQVDYAGGVDIGILKYSSDGNELLYATYLGGSQPEMPHSFIVNEFDELLIFGTTSSSNFPVSDNAYDKTFNGGDSVVYDNLIFRNGFDIFVSRISETGDELLASTYIGGSKNDGLNYRNDVNNYYGNGGLYYNYGDGARGEIITDDQNNVYIGSCTFSADFPVISSSFQASNKGMQEGIVFKLDYNLSTLVWSTYLGGGLDDAIYSIDVDRNYDLYVTGGTMSIQDTMVKFPTTQSAYMPTPAGGTRDGFVTKISNDGRQMLSSTFFGSDAYDQSYFVRSDKYNNVYIFGQTEAQGATLIHNVQYSNPNSGQFIAKFGPQLDELIWSTVFGSGIGRPNISPTAFSVDICQRIYLSGSGREWTNQARIYTNASRTESRIVHMWDDIQGTKNMDITEDAYQKETDGKDFYIMVLKPEAEGLDYATYLGELYDGGHILEKWENGQRISVETIGCPYSGHDHVDGGTSRFDKIGNIYQSVCGSCGGCQGFPVTSNAWSQSNNSTNCNNALIKFNVHNDILISDFRKPDVGCAPYAVTFENQSTLVDSTKVEFIWDFNDGTTSSLRNPSHTFQNSGKYLVQLVVNDLTSCNLTDTIIKEVIVLSDSTYNIEDKTICKYTNTIIGIEPVQDPNTSYKWFPETGISDPTLPNPYASPEKTTKYLLVVSNGQCADSIFQTVQVDSVGAFVENLTNETCYGLCDGSVSIQSSSNGDLQYIWQDKNHSNAEANDLCPGKYNVIIANPRICTDTVTFNIAGPEKLIIDLPDTLINQCNNDCNIGIAPLVSGGSEPYSYVWNSGETSSSAKKLCEGEYWLSVTDINGCSSSDTAIIEILRNFDIQIKNVKQPVCFGDCDGTAEIEVAGEISNYTIEWKTNPIQSTPKAINLCAGDYIVSVTDSSGCQLQKTVEISSPLPLSTAIASKQNPECGFCNGEITLTSTNGKEPYSFLWNDHIYGNSRSGLCGGEYQVVITDSNNCTDSVTIQMQAIGNFEIDKQILQPVSCFGDCNGNIQLLILNSVGEDFNYIWSGYPDVKTSHLSGICAGTYHFTIQDKNGCAVSDSIILTQPDELIFDHHINSSIQCYGSQAEIQLLPSGGTPDYEFLMNSNKITSLVQKLPAGEYNFRLNDANACQNEFSVIIKQPEKLSIDINSTHQLCTNNCNGEILLSPNGGTGPYKIIFNSNESGEMHFQGLCAGGYPVQLIDNNACSVDTVVIIENDEFMPQIEISPMDTVLYPGQSTLIITTSNCIEFHWKPNKGISDTESANPIVEPVESQYYTVTAYDENNCIVKDSVFIHVNNTACKDPYIFVPNAFTPDDNAYGNNILYVRSNIIQTMQLSIYNRWGQVVFTSRDINKGWDGTYQGRKVDPAVFVYYLKATCFNGETFEKKGNITVLR